MGPEHGAHPDVVGIGDRLPGVADHTADVELHVRGFGELEVQVGAVVIPVVGEVVVVRQAGHLLEQTVLVHIAHGHEIADLIRATGDVDVVLGLQEGLAEHQFGPLGVREHDRIAACAVGFDGLRLKVQVGVFTAVVPLVHIVVPGEVIAAGLADVGHRHLETRNGAHGDLRLAGVTALGGDDDDAVRTAHTEHRRGGGVLQDGQAFDFIRVHGVQRTLDTIDQDERRRVGVGKGTYASDVDLSVVFTRLTGLLHSGNTRHLSRQDVGNIGHRRLDQGLVVNGGQSAGHRRFGLGTVRDHHSGVDRLGVLQEHDGKRTLFTHRDHLGDITQGGNLQHRILSGNGKREASVHVGSHTGGRPLQGDARTDYRQTVCVHHITLDGNALVLCEGSRPPQCQQETQHSSQLGKMDYFLFHWLLLKGY